MKGLLLASALAFVAGCATQFKGEEPTTVNDNWLYLEKDIATLPTEADSAYEKITLPHTWNNEDTLKTKKYRRAASWYRKNLQFTEADIKNRLYLRFGAAGQRAVVYVNGERQLEHIGGYSAFTVELTGLVKAGSNRVDVMVTNKWDKMIAPLGGDFNMYGGLYRSVQLIKAPKVSISRKTLGGPGFRIWSENVSEKSAEFKVSANVDNGSSVADSFKLQAVLTNPAGKIVAQSTTDAKVKAGKTDKISFSLPKIVKPELWSPENPTLYKFTLSVIKDDEVIDQVTANHGFRWFKFTDDKGFFLNGKPYKLIGVNRHQDFYMEGNAVGMNRHDDDLNFMKELGINWLRLAHYQQDDYVLNRCDELGILVWEEIPYVNGTTFEPAYEENMRSMMKDMIEQHYNNSCVILWGMGNEVWMKKAEDGKARCWPIINRLNDLIHEEDPTRKSIFVIGDANYASDLKVMEIPDVIGYNLYRGWYGAGYETFTARCEDLRRRNPGKPFIVSEFGAGCDRDIHTEKPRRYDFSEEYQINFLESHLDQMDEMEWISGFNWWNFADFGAAHRGDSIPHVNQKGFITFDRQKKDSFYYVKARWTKDPVVYIQSPSWKNRTGKPVKQYRVFSNMDKVELFHNGSFLGTQTSGFKWDVTLKEGKNELVAIGTKGDVSCSHTIKVNYEKGAEAYVVKANKQQKGNEAENVVDGSDSTRWAAEGDATLTVDLGRISLLNSVSIKFYKGAERSYKFKLSTSPKGKTWTKLFDGKTGKNEVDLVKFDQQETRFIKIECYGSDVSNWSSIVEIKPEVTTKKKNKNMYEKIGIEANK